MRYFVIPSAIALTAVVATNQQRRPVTECGRHFDAPFSTGHAGSADAFRAAILDHEISTNCYMERERRLRTLIREHVREHTPKSEWIAKQMNNDEDCQTRIGKPQNDPSMPPWRKLMATLNPLTVSGCFKPVDAKGTPNFGGDITFRAAGGGGNGMVELECSHDGTILGTYTATRNEFHKWLNVHGFIVFGRAMMAYPKNAKEIKVPMTVLNYICIRVEALADNVESYFKTTYKQSTSRPSQQAAVRRRGSIPT